MKLSDQIVEQVADLLGRDPRGLKAVEVINDLGEPSVIRVASVVDQKPFPTLFWLIDRVLCYQIDQLEASGLIRKFQDQVDEDVTLRNSMWRDHSSHIKLRDDYLTAKERTHLKRAGYFDVLETRGIGGISNPTRIRCLHSWYAAHMVEQNTIGLLLDQHLQAFASC
mgnify:CR=1 FL=1